MSLTVVRKLRQFGSLVAVIVSSTVKVPVVPVSALCQGSVARGIRRRLGYAPAHRLPVRLSDLAWFFAADFLDAAGPQIAVDGRLPERQAEAGTAVQYGGKQRDGGRADERR
jgi:hypothetical protein